MGLDHAITIFKIPYNKIKDIKKGLDSDYGSIERDETIEALEDKIIGEKFIMRKDNHIHGRVMDNTQIDDNSTGEMRLRSLKELYKAATDILDILNEYNPKLYKFVTLSGQMTDEDYDTREKIINKNNLSYNVMTEKCEHIMPTREGFFFGSTDINYWYFEALYKLVQWYQKTMKLTEDYNSEKISVEYQSRR